jgi:ribosomal silencing factor RsfS
MAAIAEEIEEALTQQGHHVFRIEGSAAIVPQSWTVREPPPPQGWSRLIPPPSLLSVGRRGAARPMARETQAAPPPGPLAEAPQAGNGLAWVVMDCGDLLVHLFNPTARQFYRLERLWGDAPRIPLDPVE